MDFYESVLNHKTIREFQDKKIDEEIVKKIIDGVMRTATSNGLQQASVIRIKNEEKKKKIAECCGQEYVGRAPELFVFIADNFRNKKIIEEKVGKFERETDVDIFFQGFSDACLMAQNANNIIENMGLGAVFLGSVLNNSDDVIKILEMPKFTFPVLGLGFGYPNQEPQLKPRIPTEYRVFEDGYKIEDSYLISLKEYDEEMKTYYDLRDKNKRVDSFTDQVVIKSNKTIAKRGKIIEIAKENGYKL